MPDKDTIKAEAQKRLDKAKAALESAADDKHRWMAEGRIHESNHWLHKEWQDDE